MTDAQLQTLANVIKNEITAKANTAVRVGTLFNQLITDKINWDAIQNDPALPTDSGIKLATEHAAKGYVDNSLNFANLPFNISNAGAIYLVGVQDGVKQRFSAFAAKAALGLESLDPAIFVKTIKTTLSSAQIKTMFSSPPLIVPAPGSGKVVIPLSIAIVGKFGTIAYTGGSDTLYVKYPAGNLQQITATGLLHQTQTWTLIQNLGILNTSVFATFGPFENAGIQLAVDTSNPAAGDGTMDVYTTYTTYTI